MLNKIRKKLIHFYTDGNINADFAASKRRKTAELRKIIRACFYLHCAVAVVCIVIAAVNGIAAITIPVSVCVLISAGLAFLAAGGDVIRRTALYSADMIFAAAAFVAGTVANAPFLFAVGGIMLAAGLAALAGFFAGAAKDYLENYPLKLIRREDYTLFRGLAGNEEKTVLSGNNPPSLPPLTDEMRELARQVADILHGRRT